MHHQTGRKRRSSLNFARIEKRQKRRWPYFSILRGVCFLTFFDRGETEQARPFPLFSHKPHAKQDHMGAPQMAISCSQTISVFFRGTHFKQYDMTR